MAVHCDTFRANLICTNATTFRLPVHPRGTLYRIGSEPGVNYPNCAMGPFILSYGLFFFLLDQNRETGTGKTGPTVALINDNRRIKINDYSFVMCSLLIGCRT